MPSPKPRELLTSQVLAPLLNDHDNAWDESWLATRVRQLPILDGADRRAALEELVKVDLRQRWKKSKTRKTLDFYLGEYPELGTMETASLGLILAELQARIDAADKVSWPELYPRFPKQLANLQNVVRDFDQNWDNDRLKERMKQLPRTGLFRQLLLDELVKLDLRARWEQPQSEKMTLDAYLATYPELGTAETVSLDLVLTEIEVRRRAGNPVSSADLKRFPKQMAQLGRGVEKVCEKPSTPDGTPVPESATPPPQASITPPAPPSLPSASVTPPKGEAETCAHNTIRPADSAADIELQSEVARTKSDMDRYQILRELGRGAMGVVYLARDAQLGRQVALKIPSFTEKDSPEMRRFLIEAQSAATLDHPNICQVYDVGINGGIPFMTMAFIDGVPLNKLINPNQPMAQRRVVEIVAKLARALAEAHRRGIIHRDLKPSNIMMNRRGEPIVMDFGLARQMNQDARLTRDGSLLGTPAYMSFEQVTGERKDIGPSSDQYSLGVILYEMLTGQLPFQGGPAQVMLAILTKKPRPPRDLRPDIDPELEAICLKAMSASIAERFPSMGDFALALENLIGVVSAPEIDLGDDGTTGPPSSWTDQPSSQLKPPPASAKPKLGSSGGSHPVVKLPSSSSDVPLPSIAETLPGNRPAPVLPRPEPATPIAATPAPRPKSWHGESAGEPQPSTKGFSRVLMGVAAAVVGVVAVGVYFLFFTSESPEQFQANVRELIRQEKYQEALEKIAASRQEEGIKTPLQKEARDQALAWADVRLNKKEDAKQVSELMAALRQRFSGDKEVTDRFDAARQLEVELEIDGLRAKRRYKDALVALKQSPFAGAQWALATKKNLLTSWTDSATALLKEKDYDRADQVAQEIVDQEAGYAPALTIRKQAAKAIDAVKRKVSELVNTKAFAEAAKHVKNNWPLAQERFRKEILPGWYAAAAEERNKKERDKAATTLAELKSYYPEEKTEVDRLVRAIAGDGLREQVVLAIKGNKDEDLERIDQLLQGEEGKVLEATELAEFQKEVSKLLESSSLKRDVPRQITAALRLRAVTKADFEKSRATLSGLVPKAADDDKKRIETLLGLLITAQQAAENPLGTALAAFGQHLGQHAADLAADNSALQDIYNRLLDTRIRKMVSELPEAQKGQLWKQGLADVKTAKGKDLSVWASAWRLECLAELKEAGQTVKAADWDLASKGLQGLSPGDAAPYVQYVRSLADGLTSNRDKAAQQLADAYAATDLSPILQVPHRKSRAVNLLIGGARALRQPGKVEQPFGTKPNAETAYGWLKRAHALQPNQAESQLPLQLALAAWSKTKQDKELAGSLTAELAKQATLANLDRLDAYLVLGIHAATRDETPAGRRQALDSYVEATAVAQDLLSKNPEDRDLAEHVYRSIIVPAVAEKGSRLLGKAPNDALKKQLAQLCARAARMIRVDLFAWSKVPEMGDNPLNKVVELYAEAYALADKAEYLVNRAFIQCRIADPDIPTLEKDADTAIKKEDSYWGGHSLKGLALFYRSRQKETTDYADKVKALRSADQYFKNAADRAKNEKDAEELSNLYRLWSSVCLELGNYLPDNPKERDANLRNAGTYAQKATEFNKRNLEAWDALAYALEDVAWLLKDKEKYAQAVKAFDQAIQINFRSDRPRSWLGRGRAQFRWGETTNDVRKMDDADTDLGEVIDRAPKSLEAAEAHYWRSRVALFRSSKESEKKKSDTQAIENFLKRAEDGFQACRDLAKANKVPSWEEAALVAWAHLELSEGEKRKGKYKHYLNLAEKLAGDLAQFNVPEAALIRGRAVTFRSDNPDDPNTLQEAQRIFAAGMKQNRQQDKGSLLKLRINDINFRLRLGVDAATLAEEARAVNKEVAAARMDGETCGFAEGSLGVLLYISGAPKTGTAKERFHDEALAEFREAIKHAPKHGDSITWRWLLVEILDAKANQTTAETQEASQRIAEARLMPGSGNHQGRARILALDKKYNSK